MCTTFILVALYHSLSLSNFWRAKSQDPLESLRESKSYHSLHFWTCQLIYVHVRSIVLSSAINSIGHFQFPWTDSSSLQCTWRCVPTGPRVGGSWWPVLRSSSVPQSLTCAVWAAGPIIWGQPVSVVCTVRHIYMCVCIRFYITCRVDFYFSG